jgi:hypothetical protein
VSEEAWDRLFLLGAIVFAVWVGWQLAPYVLP